MSATTYETAKNGQSTNTNSSQEELLKMILELFSKNQKVEEKKEEVVMKSIISGLLVGGGGGLLIRYAQYAKILAKVKEIIDLIFPPPQNPEPEEDVVYFIPLVIAGIAAVAAISAAVVARGKDCTTTETTEPIYDSTGKQTGTKKTTTEKCSYI